MDLFKKQEFWLEEQIKTSTSFISSLYDEQTSMHTPVLYILHDLWAQ